MAHSEIPTAKLELTLEEARILLDWELMASLYVANSDDRLPRGSDALWQKLDSIEDTLAADTRDKLAAVLDSTRPRLMNMRKIRKDMRHG